MITFDEIWQREFAPIAAARRRADAARRSEAFLDITLTVCGEEIRQMTPADLLMLDGFESPFVCPSADITRADVEFFLWQLHPANSHTETFLNAFRRGQMLGRVRRLDLAGCVSEITAYCERMFADLDSPADSSSSLTPGETALEKAPSIHFLAPLLVGVAAEIGHIDPMSGRLIAETPIPRLVQYQKAAQPPSEERDGLERLRLDCLCRFNQVQAEARSAAADSALSSSLSAPS